MLVTVESSDTVGSRSTRPITGRGSIIVHPIVVIFIIIFPTAPIFTLVVFWLSLRSCGDRWVSPVRRTVQQLFAEG